MSDDRAAAIEQLESQLGQSNHRLLRLETDALSSEVNIQQRQVEQASFQEGVIDELRRQEAAAENLADELKVVRSELAKVTLRFKDLVKKDQLAITERHVNEWPLEEFISVEEFERLLKARLRP